MYHSLIISGKNTYTEWGIVPTSRPVVAMPEVKTTYVDLPGSHGVLDYTTLLLGEAPLGQREGSWEFVCKPGAEWVSVYESIANFIHGERLPIILEDDPDHIYIGRLALNEWKSDKDRSIITIDYNIDPFKFNTETVEGTQCVWRTGKTELVRTIQFNVTDSATKTFVNRGTKSAVPLFVCSASFTATKGTTTINLVSGQNTNANITLEPGENTISFSGSGTIKISYREASL